MAWQMEEAIKNEAAMQADSPLPTQPTTTSQGQPPAPDFDPTEVSQDLSALYRGMVAAEEAGNLDRAREYATVYQQLRQQYPDVEFSVDEAPTQPPIVDEAVTEEVVEEPRQRTRPTSGFMGMSAQEIQGDTTPSEAPDWVTMPIGDTVAVMKDVISGESKMTPEIEGMRSYVEMPEFDQFSLDSLKINLGTLFTKDKKEIAGQIKSIFPNVQVRLDDKGNYIFKSAVDNEEYTIVPGLELNDVMKFAGEAALFTPQGRMASTPVRVGLDALTKQTGIETTQALTGGEFDGEDVLTAGGAGYIGAKLLPGGRSQTVDTPPTQQTAPQLFENVTQAISSNPDKFVAVVRAVAPDPEIMMAYDRQGLTPYMQPSFVSTNQAFRELNAFARKQPASSTLRSETEALSKITKQNQAILEQMGGNTDLAALSDDVKSMLQVTERATRERAAKHYDDINTSIDKSSSVEATNVLKLIDDLNVNTRRTEPTPLEKKIRKILAPKPGADGTTDYPSYEDLDRIRRELTTARVQARKDGTYMDADDYLITQLETALKTDQRTALQQIGGDEALELFDLAQLEARTYNGFRDDLTALYGKKLNESLAPKVTGAFGALSKGDISKYENLMKSVPQEMRKDVALSGLIGTFAKAKTRGEYDFDNYLKWYDSLKANKTAYTRLMSDLKDVPGAREYLEDQAKIARGITNSLKTLPPGDLRTSAEAMKKMVNRLEYFGMRADAAAYYKATMGDMVGATKVGVMSGAVRYVKNIFEKKVPDAVALDELLTNPAFTKLVSEVATGNEEAVDQIAKLPMWKKFVRSVGDPIELSNPEKFILGTIQSGRMEWDELDKPNIPTLQEEER